MNKEVGEQADDTGPRMVKINAVDLLLGYYKGMEERGEVLSEQDRNILSYMRVVRALRDIQEQDGLSDEEMTELIWEGAHNYMMVTRMKERGLTWEDIPGGSLLPVPAGLDDPLEDSAPGGNGVLF